jgi:fructokinase
MPRYGLIEAGGTKFMVGTATGPDEFGEIARIPTTSPGETIPAVLGWLAERGPFARIGIASFGPVGTDPASPDWGHILATPKPGWSGTDLAWPIAERMGCPVALDSDVNAAALAEWRWGAGQGQRVVVYFTIGTGIGGGAVIAGAPLRGLSHPEMGHIRVPRHPDDRDFPGVCPFHGDCLEGLASGPAVLARWGEQLDRLVADHPAHDIVAHYLAHAVVTAQGLLAPGRIVLGGGVMHTPGLVELVREAAGMLGGGYFSDPREIVCGPALGDRAGLLGALALVT